MMNINTEHIAHASDCSLWHNSESVYICDCGALNQARYECSSDLTEMEWEMIVLHEVQIDSLRKNNLPKDNIPKENIYTCESLEDYIKKQNIDSKNMENALKNMKNEFKDFVGYLDFCREYYKERNT